MKEAADNFSTALTYPLPQPSHFSKFRKRTLTKALAGCFLCLFACIPELHAVESGKTQQLTSPDQVPEGLQKSDWQSIRAAYEGGRHAFMPVEGGWQARNPGQQWTTKFDGRGFLTQPREGAWQWGLELESYGRGSQQTKVSGQPRVKADALGVFYKDETGATVLNYTGLKV